MHRLLSFAALFVVLLLGCTEDEPANPVVPTPEGLPFEVKAWDYSTNYFFVDTTYRALYEGGGIRLEHPV